MFMVKYKNIRTIYGKRQLECLIQSSESSVNLQRTESCPVYRCSSSMAKSQAFRVVSILLILLGLTGFLPDKGWSDNIARYGGEFMAFGGGARALALGGAYTSLASDSWAIFWNPAGLMKSTSSEIGLMHSERFEGVVDYDAAAVSLPQPDGSVLAAGMIRLGVNGIPFTSLENPGSPLSEENRVEIDKIVNEGEYAFFISKAQHLGRWYWGFAPKLIFKHIGSAGRAYGLGVDVGFGGRPLPDFPVDVGFSVRDLLGTVLAWEQTGRKEIITSTIRLGISGSFEFSALEARLTPVADLSYRTEVLGGSDAAALHAGVEYLVRGTVAFRVGSDDGRTTFGGGVKLKPVSIDYAYIGHDELGDTHRISINFRWKNSKND